MNTHPCGRLVACLASLVALVFSPLSAHAVTNVWGGGGGNANWTTAANWTNSVTPTASDTVIFTNGSYASGLATALGSNWTVNTLVLSTTNTVAINGNTLTLGSGLLNRTTTSRSNQTINSAIALGADGLFIVNGAANYNTNLLINGSIGESGGSRSLTVAGLRIAHLMGSNTFTGSLLITNTAGVVVGGTNAASSVTVGSAVGAGGTLLVGGDYALGNGTLILNTNAIISGYAASRMVGNAVTANGNFTIGPSTTVNTIGGMGLTFTNAFTLNADLAISNATSSGAETVFFAGGIGDAGAGRSFTINASGVNRRTMLTNSTYTGATIVNNGYLLVSGTNATSSVAVNLGATLTFLTDNPFSASTMLTASNATLTTSNSHALSNPVTFTGTSNIQSGTGNLTVNGVVSLATSMVLYASGGSAADGFVFASNVTETLPGSSLTLMGNRSLYLLGSNSYSGGTYVSSSARLVIGNARALGTGTLYAQAASGTTTLAWTNSPTVPNSIQMQNTNLLSGLGISGNKIVFNGPVNMATNVVISLDSTIPAQDDSSAPVFNGGFNDGGSNFSLTFTGNAGTDRRLIISNSSSYGGGTFINGALVKLGGNNALPTAGALAVNGIVNLLNGFSLNGFNQTVGSLSGTGIVQLASGGTLTVGDTNNTSFGGLLVGNGSLVKQGSGTLGLSSSNSYSGGLTINAGTVALSGSSLAGGGSGLGTITLGDTAGSADATLLGDGRTYTNTVVVRAGSSGTLTMGNSGSSSTVFRGPITLNTNLTLVGGGSGSINLSSNVTGIGGLRVTGPGSVTLGGSNSFSGGVTVDGGTLNLATSPASWALGTGTLTLTNNPTLNNGSTVTLATTNAQAWNSSFTYAGNALNMGPGTITLGTNVTVNTTYALGGNLTVNGMITGAWGLTKTGATGDLSLKGSNSYSGGTTIDSGRLVVMNGDALGTGGVVINSAGLLLFSNGGVTVMTNHSGTISGNGAVEIRNTSMPFFMFSSNAYSGGTVFSGNQRVYLGDDAALGTGLITLNTTTTSFILSSTGSSTRTLANNLVVSNDVALGNSADNGVLTFAGSADLGGAVKQLTVSSDVILSGAVSNGGIIKAGVSNLTLSGNNAYAGGTWLSNGTLTLSSDTSLGAAGSGLTVAGGTLRIAGTTLANLNSRPVNWATFNANLDIADAAHTFTVTNNILGAANFSKLGAGTLVLGGSNVFAALSTVGGLELSSGIVQATGAVSIANAIGQSSVLFLHGGSSFVGPTGVVKTLLGTVSNSTGIVVVADGGSLNLTNKGGASNTAYISLGEAAGALGSLIVSNGGTVRISTAAGGPNPYFEVGRAAGARGELLIYGGSVDVNSIFHIAAATGSTGLVSVVGGRLTATNNGTLSEYLKVGTSGVGTMLISNQGVVVADTIAVGYGSGGVGLLTVTEGGRLEMTGGNYLQTGILGAVGTISNVSGGTVQFSTNAPIISAGSKNAFVSDSTIEFKGVDAASLALLNNWNYSGANTLRLVSSTNATTSYAFTNGGRFSTLELTGDNPMWKGPALLIGNGGTLRASNALATVGAVLTNAGAVSVINGQITYLSNVVLNGGLFLTQNGTNLFNQGLSLGSTAALTFTNGSSQVSGAISNSGTISAVNSLVTFGGPLVISGSYVSDPSTNTFTSNVTVTASGSISSGSGDLFVFMQDFLNQSTNATQFNLSQSAVLFTNSATHLYSISNSGSVFIGQGFTNFAQVATNFAIGQLSIAAGNRLTIAGNTDTTTNALYVGWLDIQGTNTNDFDAVTNGLAMALNLPNVNLYYDKYDPRNDWLNANLIGPEAAGYNLWGGGLLLPIPEPSVFALLGLGALFALGRRRRA